MKNIIISALFLVLASSGYSMAQAPDTVFVSDTTTNALYTTIQGDTLPNGARVNPNRVYMLYRGGIYIFYNHIIVQPGTHINIVGQSAPATGPDPGPPVVMTGVTSKGGFDKQYLNVLGNGGVTLKNIWFSYVNTLGSPSWGMGMNFRGDSENVVIDSCVFEWSRDYILALYGKYDDVHVTNTWFRNCVDLTDAITGGTSVFYFPNATPQDTVVCQNNTFENVGAVLNTHAVWTNFVWFDHNTFLNVARFAPFLSSYWTNLFVTNNIFVNCHFIGDRWVDLKGWFSDWGPGMFPYGAVLNLDTLPTSVTYPVSEANRTVVFYNNSNYTDPAFQAYYKQYNNSLSDTSVWIGAEPMMNNHTLSMFSWHRRMKMGDDYDSTNPGFIKPPNNLDSMLVLINNMYNNPHQAAHWYAFPDTDAYGDPPQLIYKWPFVDNLAYTNAKILTAGMNGLPLGDLNWFPLKKAQWSQSADWAAINLITAIEEEHGDVPGLYALDQNYPNPFNPSTKINYSVPRSGLVSLKVYNVVGQEVATLFSGVQQAGNYHATFDGSKFASGVYFYRLQAGNFCSVKKMLLMK